MILDAHVHVWLQNPDRYPWQAIGGYIPETEAPVEALLAVMDAAGVDGAVLVQPTPYGWDNSYLLDCARRYPDRLRAICLVDPLTKEGTVNLKRLVSEFRIAAIRINWNLHPTSIWQANPYHLSLWETISELNLPVCLQMIPDQMGLLRELAGKYPQVRIVIDHLGRPRRGGLPTDPSFVQLLDLARCENIHIKLSGLNYCSEQQAPYRDVWQLVQSVYRQFGAQRCMWGSDFPFVQEHWSYAAFLSTVQKDWNISAADLEWVLGGTAGKLWWQE